MSTIHTVETQIDLDFGNYIDECVETLGDRGYFVFADEEQARDFFGENNKLEKLIEVIDEAKDNVLMKRDISQDYKDLYNKLAKTIKTYTIN